MIGLIAKRYAKAFFDVSQQQDQVEVVYRDLKKLQEFMDASDEFLCFLNDPVIATDQRQKIIKSILKNTLSASTLTFLSFLDEKKRLSLLNEIMLAFEDLYLELKETLKITITAATRLTDNQVSEIKKHLKTRFNKNIQQELKVDSTMIGGIQIQIDDEIFDYSFKAQLEQFRKHLIEA